MSINLQAMLLVSVLGVILTQEFNTDINHDLANKLTVSSPQFNKDLFGRLSRDLSIGGSFFTADGDRSQLTEIKNREIKIWRFTLRPFHEVGVLNWGTKLESLTSYTQLSMQGDTFSHASVTGTLGERAGEKIRIRVASGSAALTLNTQFQTVSYQHCEWILFIKDCKTRHRQEPRGYTFDETQAVNQGILDSSHQGAVNKLKEQNLTVQTPVEVSRNLSESGDLGELKFDFSQRPLNLLELNYLEAIESKQLGDENQNLQFVAYDVPAAEVAASVNELIHGAMTPHLHQRVNEVVESGSDSTLKQPSDAGEWTIKLFKNGHGSWTVSSGR